MDDLIKRLRDIAEEETGYGIRHEAAAALESQQTELTRLRSLVSAQDAQMQLIAQEREALRADTERWRAGARGHCFPEFCGHDAYAPEGASWYMPGFVEAATFATAEEAMDAHVAALSAASEGGENG